MKHNSSKSIPMKTTATKRRRILHRRYREFRKNIKELLNLCLSKLRLERKPVNKNEIIFIGMQRSGNHAILNWIFSQFKDPKCFLNFVLTSKDPFVFFHNKGTLRDFVYQEFFEKANIFAEQLGFHSKKNLLLYSYEDEFLAQVFSDRFQKHHDAWVGQSESQTVVLLLRDPFNLFASRLKTNNDFMLKHSLRTPEGRANVVKLWKEYAREFCGKTDLISCNKIMINYNDWITNLSYRKNIAEKLNVDEYSDSSLDIVPSIGGGSSFSGTKKVPSKAELLSRWKTFKDDPLYIDIFKDSELVSLSETIFGTIPGVDEWLNSLE